MLLQWMTPTSLTVRQVRALVGTRTPWFPALWLPGEELPPFTIDNPAAVKLCVQIISGAPGDLPAIIVTDRPVDVGPLPPKRSRG